MKQSTITVLYELPLSPENRVKEDALIALRSVPTLLYTARQETGFDPDQLRALEGREAERKRLVTELGEVKIMRLVFHQVSYMDRGHYFQLWEEGRTWFRGVFGFEMGDSDKMADAYVGNARNLVHYRAEILAALPRSMDQGKPRYMVDMAHVPYKKAHPEIATLEGDHDWPEASTQAMKPIERIVEGVTWEVANLPEDWVDMEKCGEYYPPDLLDACVEATRRLNVRVLPSVPDFLSPVRRRLTVKETG